MIMNKTILTVLSALLLWAGSIATECRAQAPDGVQAVDLGLSVKWANMNVGATKPAGYGKYFAWGETQTKEFYSWKTYAWSRSDGQFMTKYSNNDGRMQLAPVDDAARSQWGGDWRMPTATEFEELVDPDKCKWEWTTVDGVNGYKVTGKKTGNSIFLPITGARFYGECKFRGIYGLYWTSTLYPTNINKACGLKFDFENVSLDFGVLAGNRFSGRPIRAVQ